MTMLIILHGPDMCFLDCSNKIVPLLSERKLHIQHKWIRSEYLEEKKGTRKNKF